MPLAAVMLASSTKEKNETERDEEGEPQRKGNTNIPYTKKKEPNKEEHIKTQIGEQCREP
jgi:hypothetical protein